jgi:hypothetical protein
VGTPSYVHILVRALVLLCLLHLPLQSHAQLYRAEAHGFSCAFPGKVDKSTLRTKDGLVVTSFFSLASDKSWGALVMTGFADPREAKNLATWFRDYAGGVRAKGFVLSDPKSIRIQGRPAVRYKVGGGGITGVGYVVIDEDRFVSIQGMVAEGKDRSMIEPFLQTLKILER